MIAVLLGRFPLVMTVFDTAIDTIFDDPDIGTSATYYTTLGASTSITAIVDHVYDVVYSGQSDVSDRRVVIGIRKSEIAAPERGATILVGSTAYIIDTVVNDDGIETQVAVH